MELVSIRAELDANVARLQQYLGAGMGPDRDFALGLALRGTCFVVTTHEGRPFFSPSRFVGYRGNTRHEHEHFKKKDGRRTNVALRALLGAAARRDEDLDRDYVVFCTNLGLEARAKGTYGVLRKYWDARER